MTIIKETGSDHLIYLFSYLDDYISLAIIWILHLSQKPLKDDKHYDFIMDQSNSFTLCSRKQETKWQATVHFLCMCMTQSRKVTMWKSSCGTKQHVNWDFLDSLWNSHDTVKIHIKKMNRMIPQTNPMAPMANPI